MDVPLPRNPLEETSVKIARSRFKNVLKHMVQDNLLHDEASDDSDNDENKLFRTGAMKNAGLGGTTVGGKRIKVEGGRSEEKPKSHPTFVMKLFDRGVDLAQFDEKTPLYPICRAWIHNKPQQNAKKAAAAKEAEKDELDISDLELTKEEGSRDVHHLPRPEPLPIDEYGRQISLRVPPPLPRPDEPFDINYKEEEAPSPALLFQNHLDRWNLIRQRWREASAYNARRYQASIDILRHIHDSRIKQDEQAAAQMNQVMENALQQQEMEEQEQLEQQQLEQEQLEQQQVDGQDQLEQEQQEQEQLEQEGQEQEQGEAPEGQIEEEQGEEMEQQEEEQMEMETQ